MLVALLLAFDFPSECTDVFFADADGDGHGDPDAWVTACEPPSGYVSSNDDCDDTRAWAYLGARERMTDGVDDDCSGRAAVRTIDSLPLWRASGSVNRLGVTIAMDDFDADGDADLALGGTSYLPTTTEGYGAPVAIFDGPLHRGSVEHDAGSADALLFGARWDSTAFVCAVGDLDADGAADLVVGAPGASPAGVAYIVRGPISGAIDLTTDAEALYGTATYEGMGVCAGRTDVDGDGRGDIVVGAPGEADYTGAVYVLAGPDDPASIADAVQVLEGADEDEYIGGSVTALGDVDGDGLDDFSVTNRGTGYPDSVAAYLVLDHASEIAHPRDVGVTVHVEGYHSQAIVSRVDDVNGDGYRDVGISDGWSNSGSVEVFEGPFGDEPDLSLADDWDVTLSSSAVGDGAAAGTYMLAFATPLGDWNGDGNGALALADPYMTPKRDLRGCFYEYGTCGGGGIYIIATPLDDGVHDLAKEADRIVGTDSWDDLGGYGDINSLAGGADLNGDGRPDLAFGAPTYYGSTNEGIAFVRFGIDPY